MGGMVAAAIGSGGRAGGGGHQRCRLRRVGARVRNDRAARRNLAEGRFVILDIPRAALFLAGKAFAQYRRVGGTKTGVLPDFLIGAHALVEGVSLITRDSARYRTYFPGIG